MGKHVRRIGLGHLANDFCRNCRDEEEDETVPHLLGTCPALCQRGVHYMDDLEELSRIDIGGINRFCRSSEWFRNSKFFLDKQPPLPTIINLIVFYALELKKIFS